MPGNVFEYMEEVHINLTWTELQERFGFPIKEWKKHWTAHLNKQPKGESDIAVFMRYGNVHINPILNGILMRNEGHPSFNKLVEYVIKKSGSYDIALKKAQDQRNRYKGKS